MYKNFLVYINYSARDIHYTQITTVINVIIMKKISIMISEYLFDGIGPQHFKRIFLFCIFCHVITTFIHTNFEYAKISLNLLHLTCTESSLNMRANNGEN